MSRSDTSGRQTPTTICRLLACGLVLALITAACASESEDAETPATTVAAPETVAATTAAEEPAETMTGTERLVYGVLAPQVESNDIDREVQPQDDFQLRPIYENLIGNNPATGQWEPMLAESWEIEGNSLRMHLRQGVEFHNGMGEFTAADVVFTLDHLVNPAGAQTGIADVIRETVDEIEVVNDHEIVFHLASASYEFLEALSYGATGTAMMSKADFDARGGAIPGLDEPPLAGTGPYRFLERTPGVNVVFERVDDHWRKTGAFQEVEYRYFNDVATLQAALLAGEVHVTELPSDLTDAAVAAGMVAVESGLPGTRIALNFVGAFLDPPATGADDPSICENRNDSPWWDVRLRRAASKAVDRDALNQAFYGGRGSPLYLWFWLPEVTGWDPAFEERFADEYGYDPDAARALLQEAGYADDEHEIIVLGTPDSGSPESGPVMEAVAGMLSDVGFNVRLEIMDDGEEVERLEGYYYSGQAALEYDVFNSEIVTGFDAQGHSSHGSGRTVENCAIDEQYRKVVRLWTAEEQDEPYRELGHMVYDFVGHLPLFQVPVLRVFNPEVVSSYTFPGSGVGSLYTFIEHIEAA